MSIPPINWPPLCKQECKPWCHRASKKYTKDPLLIHPYEGEESLVVYIFNASQTLMKSAKNRTSPSLLSNAFSEMAEKKENDCN